MSKKEAPNLEQLQAEIQAAKLELTKKNEQYVYQVEKAMKELNLSAEKEITQIHLMLETIVANQKKGVTARQLFGTPQEAIHRLEQEINKKPENNSPLLIWLDGSLLLGGLFALMGAITMMFSNGGNARSMGLVTLLINFIVGGGVLLVLAKYQPDFSKPKGQRGYWKYFAMSMGVMALWVALIWMAQAFIPETINISLSALAYLVIGGAALGLKYYLKKTYNIVGTIM